MSSNPIGIFDSGLGGLTVWREVRRQLPAEDVIYFADSLNCPYGHKSADEIVRPDYCDYSSPLDPFKYAPDEV